MKLKALLWTVGVFTGLFLIISASADPGIESRAKELEKQIIAPCCWTNPISEHHSEISYELRKRIRLWLEAGSGEEQIKNLLVAEYGERILAKPRARGFNILVWVIPPILFLLVLTLGLRYLKSRVRRPLLVVEPESKPAAEQMNQARRSIEEELKKIQKIG
jgi:cytochrome c-type biogenesis protein CcmH/NrfF